MTADIWQLLNEVAETYASSEVLRDALQRFGLWWKGTGRDKTQAQQRLEGTTVSHDLPARKRFLTATQELHRTLRRLSEPDTEFDPSSTVPSLEQLAGQINRQITTIIKADSLVQHDDSMDPYVLADKSTSGRLGINKDVQHVRTRLASQSTEQWLHTRLGAAVTKRRQYLLWERSRKRGVGQRGSHPDFASVLTPMDDDKTYGHNAREDPRIPALSFLKLGGDSFQCPCCRNEQTFADEESWREHFLSDLRPYVCTFEHCGLLMFADWDSWYIHEMETHRRQWICPCCDASAFFSSKGLISHLDGAHPYYIIDELMRDLIATVSVVQEVINLRDCPLCELESDEMAMRVPSRAFMAHLGEHLEDLALDTYQQFSATVTRELSETQAPTTTREPNEPQEPTTTKRKFTEYMSSASSQYPSPYSILPSTLYCSWPDCTYTCNRNADLERHYQSTHNRESAPLVDCAIPGCHRKGTSGFTRRDKMVDHVREVHKVDLPKSGDEGARR